MTVVSPRSDPPAGVFLAPEVHVVRHKELLGFGTRLMTPAQANSYRLGYSFMALGFIFTFR